MNHRPLLALALLVAGRATTRSDAAHLASLRAPLLGLFGAGDQGIPGASVREMETARRALHKDATIVVYPGAGHAFANPSGQGYRAAAADDAWTRLTGFFAQHLQAG